MVYEHYRDHWVKSICPGEVEVQEFWLSQRGNPLFDGHPLFAEGLPEKTIPLALHGDAIPTTAVGKAWGKSTDIVSWQSLVASRGLKTLESLLWLMYSSLYVKTFALDTTRAIWKVVAWSFRALQDGMWPELDHRGHPFAPGLWVPR